MAREIYAFQVTIPAGTTLSAPYQQATPMPVREVTAIEMVIPPGPSGLMGFALTMGGVWVMPVTSGTYVVTDDERIVWPVEQLPTSGSWQVTGYNTDVYPHTVYMRWLVDLLSAPQQTGVLQGIDLAML